jgi:hypothetical protein
MVLRPTAVETGSLEPAAIGLVGVLFTFYAFGRNGRLI